MSIPSWPVTLPPYLLQSGYSEALPKNIIRSPMEVGPAKVRRRGTSGVRQISGKQYMTSAELAIFIPFFETDLLYGTLRFSWVWPVDGTTAVEFRFVEAPTITAAGGETFEVSMSLEILP